MTRPAHVTTPGLDSVLLFPLPLHFVSAVFLCFALLTLIWCGVVCRDVVVWWRADGLSGFGSLCLSGSFVRFSPLLTD